MSSLVPDENIRRISHSSRSLKFVHLSNLQPTQSPSSSTSTSNKIMDKAQPPPVDKMLPAEMCKLLYKKNECFFQSCYRSPGIIRHRALPCHVDCKVKKRETKSTPKETVVVVYPIHPSLTSRKLLCRLPRPTNSMELSRRFAFSVGALFGDIIMLSDPYSASPPCAGCGCGCWTVG